MNYNNLKYFVAIAKTGNISRAAESLYISQPTLSKQLKDLETELGRPLFLRKHHRMELTEAGNILYHWAEPFFEGEEEILEAVRNVGIKKKQSLSIGILSANFIYHLPNLVNHFRMDYPSIEVTIQRLNRNPLLEGMRRGRLDIGFQVLTGSTPDFCDCMVIESGKACLAIASTHPLAQRETLTPADLKDCAIAIMDRRLETDVYEETIRFCRSAGFEPHIAGEYTYIEPLLTSVDMGESVYITSTLSPIGRYENIKCVPFAPLMEMRLVMLWQKDTKNPAVAEFVRFMRSYLS